MNNKTKWFVVIGTLLFYILTFFIYAIVEFNIPSTSPPEYKWALDKHIINFEGIQLTVATVAFLRGLHSVCGKQKKTGYGVFFGLLLLLQGVAIFLFAWFFIIGESVKEISAFPFTPFDAQAGFGEKSITASMAILCWLPWCTEQADKRLIHKRSYSKCLKR